MREFFVAFRSRQEAVRFYEEMTLRIVGETVCKGYGTGKGGVVARTLSVGSRILLFLAKRQRNQALNLETTLKSISA